MYQRGLKRGAAEVSIEYLTLLAKGKKLEDLPLHLRDFT